MRNTVQFQSNSYYLFESTASGRSSYFESETEIDLFKSLFRRYLSKYVDVHRMYLSTEGYHILLRIRDKSTIRQNYIKSCEKAGKAFRLKFIREVWRIVSERIRILHSVFVKSVNSIRGRSGVLVQRRYKRYYFDSIEEGVEYMKQMDIGKEIKSQGNKKYGVSMRWKKLVDWNVVRGKKWVEGTMDAGFKRFVVSKLIKSTFTAHSPP